MPVERIASLLASGTEIVAQLGLAHSLVAISHECDYPPEVLDRPRVTRTRVAHDRSSQEIDDQVRAMVAAGDPLYEVDGDALAKLRPQLIVTQSQCDVCAVRYDDVLAAVRTRPELAQTQVVDLNPMSLADLERDIRKIGEAAGVSDRAEAMIESLRDRLQTITHALHCKSMNASHTDTADRVARRGPSAAREGRGEDGHESTSPETLPNSAGPRAAKRPRVACIEWIEPLMLASNWMPELVALAGGENLITVAGQHSRYHDWSELTAAEPDLIVIAPCGFDLKRTIAESAILGNNPVWRSLSAVQSGNAWAADGNTYFNRSGPRLIDSVEILAHLFYPDLVPWPLAVPKDQVVQRLGPCRS